MIVHLVGKGPGFLDAPAPSEEYELWGVNEVSLYKKVDVLFNMHDLNTLTTPVKLSLIVAEQDKVPVYTLRKYEWLSNTISYPIEEIINEHGHSYFGSSIDYMIAMAIHKGATELHLWGVCFFSNHRDVAQRCSAEYWLGVATGKGLDIHIHGESTLLKTGKENNKYGYEKVTYKNDFMADGQVGETMTLEEYDKLGKSHKKE